MSRPDGEGLTCGGRVDDPALTDAELEALDHELSREACVRIGVSHPCRVRVEGVEGGVARHVFDADTGLRLAGFVSREAT